MARKFTGKCETLVCEFCLFMPGVVVESQVSKLGCTAAVVRPVIVQGWYIVLFWKEYVGKMCEVIAQNATVMILLICIKDFLFNHLAKSYILKSSPKFTCYTTNTVSDVYLFSPVFTQFTYFPQDVSKPHTLL